MEMLRNDTETISAHPLVKYDVYVCASAQNAKHGVTASRKSDTVSKVLKLKKIRAKSKQFC